MHDRKKWKDYLLIFKVSCLTAIFSHNSVNQRVASVKKTFHNISSSDGSHFESF